MQVLETFQSVASGKLLEPSRTVLARGVRQFSSALLNVDHLYLGKKVFFALIDSETRYLSGGAVPLAAAIEATSLL